MDYADAFNKAQKIKSDLDPYCGRIEIAGSIRRQKSDDIKDIEIICIPTLLTNHDMFGMPARVDSVVELVLPDLLKEWRATTIKNGEKYKAIIFPDATKLDLFIVTPETWGVQFALRTGPANYSRWLVTRRNQFGGLPSFAKVENGRVWVHGKTIDTPEEIDFFNFLEIPMPDPWERREPTFEINR